MNRALSSTNFELSSSLLNKGKVVHTTAFDKALAKIPLSNIQIQSLFNGKYENMNMFLIYLFLTASALVFL